MARILGKELFGQFGIIQSTVGMFGSVAGFGLGLTSTRFLARFREEDPDRASRILALSGIASWGTGFLGALLLLLFAPWLALQTMSAQELANPLKVSSLLILLGAVNGAQTGALAGLESFKRIAQVNILSGLTNFPCVVIGCWAGGLSGAVWGLVAPQTIGCILNRWAITEECRRLGVPIWSSAWRAESRLLWEFSLPATLASLFVAPTLWFCQTLLLKCPAGFERLAEYSVGVQWRTFLQYIPSLMCSAYLPIAASLRSNDQHRKRRFLLVNLGFSSGLTSAAAILIFLASPWILRAYGAGFQGAHTVLGLMLIAGIIDSASMMVTQSLIASDQVWLRLLTNGCWAIMMGSASLILVPKYCAIGLAFATCIAYSFHLVIQVPYAMFLRNVK